MQPAFHWGIFLIYRHVRIVFRRRTAGGRAAECLEATVTGRGALKNGIWQGRTYKKRKAAAHRSRRLRASGHDPQDAPQAAVQEDAHLVADEVVADDVEAA